MSPACLLTRRKGSKFGEKSPLTSSIKLLKMSFFIGTVNAGTAHLERDPIFYIFKAVHADQQAISVGVVTKRFAQQQKIAMFKIGKGNIQKFGFSSCCHMIF
jgi:hypothetical protein